MQRYFRAFPSVSRNPYCPYFLAHFLNKKCASDLCHLMYFFWFFITVRRYHLNILWQIWWVKTTNQATSDSTADITEHKQQEGYTVWESVSTAKKPQNRNKQKPWFQGISFFFTRNVFFSSLQQFFFFYFINWNLVLPKTFGFYCYI